MKERLMPTSSVKRRLLTTRFTTDLGRPVRIAFHLCPN